MTDLTGYDPTGERRDATTTHRGGMRHLAPSERRPARSVLPQDASLPDGHVLDLIPGYALGALDADEILAVDRHAATCAVCAAELESSRRTVSVLPFVAAPARPPADVKASLFMRIGHSQTIASAQSRSTDAAVSWAQVTKARSNVTLPASGPWMEQPSAAQVPAPERSEATKRRRRLPFSPMVGITTPLVLMIGLLGMWSFSLRETVNLNAAEVASLQDRLATIQANTAAPDVSNSLQRNAIFSGAIQLSQEADVVLNDVGGTTFIIVRDLRDATPSYAYDVWAVSRDGGYDLATSVTVDARGNGSGPLELPRAMTDYDGICITEAGEVPAEACVT